MRESMKNNGQTRLVRRCRLRIFLGAAALILGAAAHSGSGFFGRSVSPSLSGTEKPQLHDKLLLRHRPGADHCRSFLLILRNRSYLKDPERRRQQEIRGLTNAARPSVLKSWAYAGYSLFILLYVMILLSGFVSVLMVKLLLCIMAAFAGLLIIWRMILSRRM